MKSNNNIFGILFVLVAAALLIITVALSIKRLKQNRQIDKNLEGISEINAQTVNSNRNSWINSKSQVIIVYYNSTCNNCRFEIKAIENNLDSFKETNLLFISDEPKETIDAFSKKFLLRDLDTVWWLKMEPEDVYNTFGYTRLPHIWIYKDGKLIKELKGLTKVEAILQWL